MKTAPLVLCALMSGLAVSCGFLLAQRPDDVPPPDPARGILQVRPGMTATEVRRLMGPPARVARQILYRRYLEQWAYDNPNPVWIEFNYVKGQEPSVLALHPPRGGKP